MKSIFYCYAKTNANFVYIQLAVVDRLRAWTSSLPSEVQQI
jgi:hypothetical protein